MIGKVIGKISAVLVILGLITGCSDKKHIPSGVLPREKMEDVLWDMIQADQYSSFLTKDSTRIDIKLERLRLYDQVFRLHGVSRDQFRKSYDYYMAHPDLTQALLDSLQSKGTRLRSEAYSRPSTIPVAPAAAPAPITPSPTPSSPDTTHKSPVHRALIPAFDRPGHKPMQGRPSRDSTQSIRNARQPTGDTAHPRPKPGAKQPVR